TSFPNSKKSVHNQNCRLLMSVPGGPNDFFAGSIHGELVSQQDFMREILLRVLIYYDNVDCVTQSERIIFQKTITEEHVRRLRLSKRQSSPHLIFQRRNYAQVEGIFFKIRFYKAGKAQREVEINLVIIAPREVQMVLQGVPGLVDIEIEFCSGQVIDPGAYIVFLGAVEYSETDIGSHLGLLPCLVLEKGIIMVDGAVHVIVDRLREDTRLESKTQFGIS